jgi:hypothetical protein
MAARLGFLPRVAFRWNEIGTVSYSGRSITFARPDHADITFRTMASLDRVLETLSANGVEVHAAGSG